MIIIIIVIINMISNMNMIMIMIIIIMTSIISSSSSRGGVWLSEGRQDDRAEVLDILSGGAKRTCVIYIYIYI